MCNNCHSHHSCHCNTIPNDEILDLKKPITGEVIEDKMLLIRDNEVIGELPIPNFASTIVFLDAFGNVIPNNIN